MDEWADGWIDGHMDIMDTYDLCRLVILNLTM